MTAKKSPDAWFAEYGESHQDSTNELIHWICVPVIFGCVLGFIHLIPVPAAVHLRVPWFDWAVVAVFLAAGYYFFLSPALSAGLFLFMALCYAAIVAVELLAPWPVSWICGVAFVLAWVGQFIGHRIEGKKPSFFKDVLFLLIGPAWLMSLAYKKVGLTY